MNITIIKNSTLFIMKRKNNISFSKSISESFTKTLIEHLNFVKFDVNDENNENSERIMLNCFLLLTDNNNSYYSTQKQIHAYTNDDDLIATNNNVCYVILESVRYSYDLWCKETKFILNKIFYDEKLKKLENKLHVTKIQFNYKIEIYSNFQTSDNVFLFLDKITKFFRNKYFVFEYYGTKLYAHLNPFYNSSEHYTNNVSCESDKITFNIIVDAYYPLSKVNFDSLLYCKNDELIDWNNINIEKNDEKNLSQSQSKEIIKKYSDDFKKYFKETFNEEIDLGDINNAFWYIHLLYDKEII